MRSWFAAERGAWLRRIVWAGAVAGALYLAGLTLWLGAAGLAFPYQLDYGEGFLLHLVRAWSQGEPIYKGMEGYPYVMANYPPLVLWLALALTPMLGISYAAGRIWTVLAIVATTALLIAWVRREGGRRLPALAAGLLFLGSPYIYHWAPLFRVDLPGLALTLGGLYVVAWGWSRPARSRIGSPPAGPEGQPSRHGSPLRRQRRLAFWLATLLFVAALYAKQSFLFAPAAAVAYLLLVDRRAAVGMVAALGGLGGGLFVLITALTGGGFWYGLVASNVNPFLWSEFWKQLADFLGTFAPLVLLAGWYLVDKFLIDGSAPLRVRLSPLDFYLPAALASLWFAGKAGAWENYFFEALAAVTVAAGVGLARLGRHPGWLAGVAVPALVLLQVGFMWHTPGEAQRYLVLTRRSNEGMVSLLAATPDPIASEDMGLLVTNGKVMDYCSFQYSQLARAGRWDQAWELNRLRQGAFSLVILEKGTRLDVDHYQRFTREFLSALDRNYRHTRTIGKYKVYEPDPLQHEWRATFGQDLALVGWSLRTGVGRATTAAEAAPTGAPDWSRFGPGDTLRMDVVWEAQRPLEVDYAAFAHLVDGEGRGWAGDDHQPYEGLYPTSTWAGGEMVRDTFTLTVPVDAPAGLYDVQVGWYNPATQERLPVAGGRYLRLGVVPVDWQPTGAEALRPLDVDLCNGTGCCIRLEGYHWWTRPDVLEVTLRWRANEHVQGDYHVFVHLLEDGRLVSQGDGPPLGGRWPTMLWLPGVALDDVHRVPLPAGLAGDVPGGRYSLLVGLYDPVTEVRLLTPDGADAVRLGGNGMANDE